MKSSRICALTNGCQRKKSFFLVKNKRIITNMKSWIFKMAQRLVANRLIKALDFSEGKTFKAQI